MDVKLPFAADKLQKVLGIDDADDVVQVVLIHRYAGITGFHGHLDDLLQGGGGFHSGGLGPVGHHGCHRAVVKLEDVVDHVLLALFDDAFFLAHIHHHADFFLGDLLWFLIGAVAQHPQQQAGEAFCRSHKGQ